MAENLEDAVNRSVEAMMPDDIKAALEGEEQEDGKPKRGKPLPCFAIADEEGNIVQIVKTSDPDSLPESVRNCPVPDITGDIIENYKIDPETKLLTPRAKSLTQEMKEKFPVQMVEPEYTTDWN